jgi:hypothetical protein
MPGGLGRHIFCFSVRVLNPRERHKYHPLTIRITMAPRDRNNGTNGDSSKPQKASVSYPGYQNGEGIALLTTDDEQQRRPDHDVNVCHQVNNRVVILSFLAFFCTCLLVGSFVMHYDSTASSSKAPVPAASSSSVPSPSSSSSSLSDSSTTLSPTDTDTAGSGGPAVQPNDFDAAKVKDGTRLSELNEATATAAHTIPAGCETTILIIRHCEKQGPSVADKDNNQHCSYVGHQRAHYLPTLFGTNMAGTWPAPSLLYALSEDRGGHVNYREVETLQPLASKFGLDILKHESNKDVAADILNQLAQGRLCGKVVLISWEHSVIGDLAVRLGCQDCPTNYTPDSEFDKVWMIRYVYNVLGTPVFQDKHPVEDDDDDDYETDNDKVQEKQDTDEKEPKDKTTTKTKNGKDNKKHIRQRQLKEKTTTKKKKPAKEGVPQWSVFSTIASQNFDPLKFSNEVGDYDGSGAPGGKWLFYGSNNHIPTVAVGGGTPSTVNGTNTTTVNNKDNGDGL